jgi:peptide deformylase
MKKLVKSDDAVLKQIAEPWDFSVDGDAKELEIDLVQAMIMNNGIGLAAPQVGISKSVFAIKLTDQVPFCMFNPEIESHSTDLVDSEEGCLSFPNLFLKVKRYSSVRVKYFDRTGQMCIMDLTGTDARCVQHELDHLSGVCFTSKISPLKLALAIKKQRKRNGRTK